MSLRVLARATAALLWVAVAVALPQSAGAAARYDESSLLGTRVGAGTLPPVEERLPAHPLLVEPEEMIGRYGGAWHMVMLGQRDGALAYRTIGYEPLVRWDQAWTRVLPGVAQSFEVNDEASVFTQPDNYLPFSDKAWYGIAWARWLADPADPAAQEPPAAAKRQFELYGQIVRTTDPKQQDRLVAEILDLAADQFYLIGVAQGPTLHGIARPNFRNVPPITIDSWIYPNPGPSNPCQFFLADE